MLASIYSVFWLTIMNSEMLIVEDAMKDANNKLALMWVMGTSSAAPGGPTFLVEGTMANALPG